MRLCADDHQKPILSFFFAKHSYWLGGSACKIRFREPHDMVWLFSGSLSRIADERTSKSFRAEESQFSRSRLQRSRGILMFDEGHVRRNRLIPVWALSLGWRACMQKAKIILSRHLIVVFFVIDILET